MQFGLRPYIIYLILNLVHYLIQTYFYHYYVPVIALSFVGLSVSSPSVCYAGMRQGCHRNGKSLGGKWNSAKRVAQLGTELEMSHE